MNTDEMEEKLSDVFCDKIKNITIEIETKEREIALLKSRLSELKLIKREVYQSLGIAALDHSELASVFGDDAHNVLRLPE